MELQCIQCETRFEKSFESRRGADLVYTKGQKIHLDNSVCPNKCGGDWFMVEREHPIRKFKRYY